MLAGKVLRSWGANTVAMPHMITVDRDGAVWVADTGLHQVLKFNDAGRLLLTLGQKFQPGSDKTHLCKPAHVSGWARVTAVLQDHVGRDGWAGEGGMCSCSVACGTVAAEQCSKPLLLYTKRSACHWHNF